MDMSKMFDSSKLMDRFFRKVDNVVWDMTTGGVGITTSEGIATLQGEGEDAEVMLNPFDQFGMAVPAFAQNTPTADVKLGDVIYGFSSSKQCGWVVERKAKSFVVLKPDGTRVNWSAPKVAMLGFNSGVMVLRSLVNMLPNGKDGLNNMNNMLMPMMMMSDGGDIESMMPMLLMSQMGNTIPAGEDGAESTNPMSGMMNNNMMQMMMFSQMMKSSKGDSNNRKSSSRPGSGFFQE